jgi:hypothetical protein
LKTEIPASHHQSPTLQHIFFNQFQAVRDRLPFKKHVWRQQQGIRSDIAENHDVVLFKSIESERKEPCRLVAWLMRHLHASRTQGGNQEIAALTQLSPTNNTFVSIKDRFSAAPLGEGDDLRAGHKIIDRSVFIGLICLARVALGQSLS